MLCDLVINAKQRGDLLHMSRSFKICAVAAAVLTGGVSQAQDPAGGPSAPSEVRAMLDEMASVIADAVSRNDTDHIVFDGCIDWHSSVHGHWALLRIARVTGEHQSEARWVIDSLTPAGVAGEAAYLRERPDFEMPYGRAWFLRLAMEYESRPDAAELPARKEMAAMADEVAQSLLAYLESRRLSPEVREYGNQSWALVQLSQFYRHRRNNDKGEQVDELIEESFLRTPSTLGFGVDHDRPDFFSCFGNWAYLIAKTNQAATVIEFWERRRPSDAVLLPVEPQPRMAHHLGMNWSRAWALRAVARVVNDDERDRLNTAFDRHVEAGMATHAEHKNDYGAYGHWVPQFAVYALTE